MKFVRKRAGDGNSEKGSSLIFVILLITLLSVFSAGYAAISAYYVKSARMSADYMEARLAAKTIHRSFCEAVSSGASPAANGIWELFEEDCCLVWEEFEELTEESDEDTEEGEGGEDSREEAYEEDEASDEIWVMEEDGIWRREDGAEAADAAKAEGSSFWEMYLRERMEDCEYEAHGMGSGENGEPETDILLRVRPLEGSAFVCTRVRSKSFTFVLKADILFDNEEGDVLLLPGKGSLGRGQEEISSVTVYKSGKGVWRYYGEEPGLKE